MLGLGAGAGSAGGGCGADAEECSSCSCSEAEAEGEAEGPLAQLLSAIVHESRHNMPDQCFSRELRQELERMSCSARCALVSRRDRGAGGNAPLFVASAAGNVPLVEYLADVCGAPLEQEGVYRAPHEGTEHRATPLWAAAVAGRVAAVRALHARGALLDAPSDSGSTPLRSACFMSHVEVARYLVAHGADVARANHHGGTCLVNAVQSAPLCRLLVAAGAPLDARDSQLKTALHYAIEEHREEAARVLLQAGADPALRTRQGDDALQLAAVKGATRLVHELSERAGPARAADALELLGATQLDVYNSSGAAVACWQLATQMRLAHHLPKRPVRARPPPGLVVREWTAETELEAHWDNGGWLRAQALLVALRVLGPAHHETQFRLMDRGAADADRGRYARAAALWSWVLEQQLRQHTLLHTETMQTLVALTRLLQNAGMEYAEGGGGALLPPRAATDALRTLVAALPESARLVAQRPMCRAQAALWERALRCATHLVATADTVWPLDPHNDHLHKECREQVGALVRLQLRSAATGDSLLHLACSRLNVVQSPYFPERTNGVFPSVEVARLLLQCGELATHRNHARSTPLHIAAIPYNFSTEMVELLVSWGAHLDQPNRFGDRPSELVQQNRRSRICPLRHVTLACLAARALLAAPPRRPAPRLPASLAPFLALHAP